MASRPRTTGSAPGEAANPWACAVPGDGDRRVELCWCGAPEPVAKQVSPRRTCGCGWLRNPELVDGLSVYLLRIPWNKECLSPYPMIVPVFHIGLSGNASCGHAVNGKVMFKNTEWNGWGALVSDKPGLQTPGLELFNWVYLHVFPTGIGGDICLLSTVKHISAGVPHLSSNQWHADNRSRSVFRQTQDASQHAVATLQVLGFAHPKTISKVRMGSSLMGCYTKNNNL